MSPNNLSQNEVLATLKQHREKLHANFGVHSIAVFGSVARNQARADSDVDILVTFDGPATSSRFFGTQFYLEDLLKRPVDLVTDKALRPELKPFIVREAIYV